ncbi:MAG: transposase, partial [Phycisphaerae bacterium]
MQLIFLSRCVVEFDREQSSSDGGALLLREVDRRLRLTERLAACFADQRDHRRLEHSVEDMLRQRVFSLALGYEDLNDQELLKKDPMLRLLISKKDQEQDLAAKTTVNR